MFEIICDKAELRNAILSSLLVVFSYSLLFLQLYSSIVCQSIFKHFILKYFGGWRYSSVTQHVLSIFVVVVKKNHVPSGSTLFIFWFLCSLGTHCILGYTEYARLDSLSHNSRDPGILLNLSHGHIREAMMCGTRRR